VAIDVLAVDGGGSAAGYLRAAARVLALNVAGRRYDVVHAQSGHCGVLAALQLRSPVVLSYMGYDLDGALDRRVRGLEQRIFRSLSLAFAATIAKSARGRSALPAHGRSRNAVIPNGVDRELFGPRDRAESRRRLGWDETPVILFAADPDDPLKDFALAEAAVERLRRRVPGVRLVTAGSIDPEEMPVWMGAADVLLLTSRSEGSPNVVKEAMACNLPIVSTDVGDVRDVFGGARHCHVCERDPDVLGGALAETLAASPERSDGRDRTGHLGSDVIAGRLAEVYVRAARRGPGLLGFLGGR
jgi:glycosyltransferase involved in cell wall biosynthesis